MNSVVFGLRDIDNTRINVVGGKAANLGELTMIDGIHVPDGFYISTDAFKRIIDGDKSRKKESSNFIGTETSSLSDLLEQLSLIKLVDRDKIGALSGEIRKVIEGTTIPQDIREEITRFLTMFGEKHAYAVQCNC